MRLLRARTAAFVVSERPLTVLEVRPAALRLLARLEPGRDVLLPAPRPAELRLLRRLADAGLATLSPAAGAGPPRVAIVVPVRDRPAALAACLRSLAALRHPAGRLQVIVVDDGSDRPVAVPPGVRLVRLQRSAGPAAARNAGARHAPRADLLAFLDSDCTAEPGWLEALVPELADPEVAAAGGRVVGASERTWLERYEAVRSPLDLGARPAADVGPGRPVSFLVTANLVVRRADFEAAGGFDEGLRWGEDVDLCWRLREGGRRLVYQPAARVRHRHRGDLASFVTTRASYAGSEAELLLRHPGAGRWLGLSAGTAALLIGATAALLRGRRTLLAAGAVALAMETAATARQLDALGIPPRRAVPALLRGQAAGFYWAARQSIRYYGGPALVAALSLRRARPGLLVTLAALAAGPAIADWWRSSRRQNVFSFAAAYALDDAAYQIGLLLGCARRLTLRPLRVSLRPIGRRGAG